MPYQPPRPPRAPAVQEITVNQYVGRWYEVYINTYVEQRTQRGTFCATAQVSLMFYGLAS